MTLVGAQYDSCINPPIEFSSNRLLPRGMSMPIVKRATAPSPGYTTVDDFGTDGDDTIHKAIPFYSQPNALQANVSFPTNGILPAKVDLVFLDFIAPNVIAALNSTGGSFSTKDVQYYVPKEFTTNSYLPVYAQMKWQKNLFNCSIGAGIGA
jgi:hypothetical protein